MFKIKTMTLTLSALAISSMGFISTATANEAQSCEAATKEHASLYYSKSIELDGDPGKLYEQAIAQVNDIAMKNEFKDYKITSNNISISTSGYNGMLDVSIGIDIEYLSDFKAITALSKNSTATSISSQRYFEACE